MFKFVHAADVHLDSPLRGLERYETAPAEALRNASRRALENLVRLALDEGAAFVLLAGDLYDGDWRDYNTGLFFTRQMARLGERGIPVFVVAGNHDAQSKITKALHPPANVHVFPTKKPDTKRLDEIGVAIHGQGYARQDVNENLAAGFPEADHGFFNIGLLHTSLDGRLGHEPYAPCTVDQLKSKGYRYWALGHVHAGEEVSRDPYIVFPGCTQGRHARETGAKGCRLVTVDGGEVVAAEHRDLDVVRWSLCAVDLEGAGGPDEALERAGKAVRAEIARAGERPLALRLRLTGACKADARFKADPGHWTQEFRALAASLGTDGLWVEKVEFETRPRLELGEALARGDALAALIRSIQAVVPDPERLAGLARGFEALKARLPEELTRGDEPLDPSDPAALAVFLGKARELLLGRLLAAEDEP